MGNGLCERFNSTLLNMLGTLEDEQKGDWKKFVPSLVHAYNATKHDSTGYSPFYLMFGRHPRLPVDLAMGTEFEERDAGTTSQYVEELAAKLSHAYEAATKESRAAAAEQKKRYDRRVRGATVAVGDRVLVKNVGLRGKQKLANKFEDQIYVVQDQPDHNVPVFVVETESGRKNRRVLHRNLLLPVNFLPLEVGERPKPTPRRVELPAVVYDQESNMESSSESDSESDGSCAGDGRSETVSQATPSSPTSAPRPRQQPQELHSQVAESSESEGDRVGTPPPTPVPRPRRQRRAPDRYMVTSFKATVVV
jgi:hypothetical protein